MNNAADRSPTAVPMRPDQTPPESSPVQPPAIRAVDEAFRLQRMGRVEDARSLLAQTWESLHRAGDCFGACVVAHFLAGLFADERMRLFWHQRAYADAQAITQAAEADACARLYPSLHLNLAESHRRLGDSATATQHLSAARAAVAALPEGYYRQTVLRAIETTETRLQGHCR